MADEGIALWRDHTGWASMGPLAAIPRIPKLLSTMWKTAAHIGVTNPDLVVLVDFGAFNLRLARELRVNKKYPGPILDVFPPATWLDDEKRAREVSAYTVPLTAFEHQYLFYKSHRLPVVYFGHPLAGQYAQRPPRDAPPFDAGAVALLPGSRAGELKYHLPVLAAAYKLLKSRRPHLHGIFGAANDAAAAKIRGAIARERLADVVIERGVAHAIENADAAWVASGTAVLEATLLGVPSVALYIISPILVRHARRVYAGKYITLPNLIVGRELVPELLQDDATPQRLAAAMESVLADPSRQYDSFDEMRRRLGPPDALESCAKFCVALAKVGSG